MEDFSSLIWLGVVILWFLTRLVRRGAGKVAGGQKKRPRPTVSRPTVTRTKVPPTRAASQPDFSDRDGTGPPPIVPR